MIINGEKLNPLNSTDHLYKSYHVYNKLIITILHPHYTPVTSHIIK